MMENERPWPLITEEEADLLQGELLRRAASGFEQIGSWWQAAECWAERGESERASILYMRGGDHGRAARVWLLAGHYQEALQAYQQWEQQLMSGNILDQIQALLGQAACHLLGTRGSSLRTPVQDFSDVTGRQVYQRARKLLAQATGPIFLLANCWEALGDYGGWLGHYTLVQEGYEQALAVLESKEEGMRQSRICRSYLVQARAHTDHLLCQQLEERLVVLAEATNEVIMALLPVEQLTLRRTLIGHSNTIRSIVISADGQLLVSGSSDKTIKVWDLSTGQEVHTLTGHSSDVYSVAISADGRTLVSGSSDKTIKVWDLSTGQEVSTFLGHTDTVYCVAISADGRTLVSGSSDMTIKMWDLSTHEEVRTLTGHGSDVYSIAISADGQTLVSGGWDNKIKLWHMQTGMLVRTLTGYTDDINSVAISPDGQTLVSGGEDAKIKVWEVSTGQEVHTLTEHTKAVERVKITPDGQMLISCSRDKTIKIWDLTVGTLVRTITSDAGSIVDVAISPDGQTLVGGSGDGTIKVWGV